MLYKECSENVKQCVDMIYFSRSYVMHSQHATRETDLSWDTF
jgi:hypothetical protein